MTASEESVIDIADYAARNERPPPGRSYRFRLDKTPYVADKAILLGAEILAFGAMDPQHFNLFQAFRGGRRVPVAPDQKVDLSELGVERFFTMKNEHTNGDGSGAREFELPPDDCEHLVDIGLPWEAKIVSGQRWLVLRGWTLPRGFQVERADIALRIDPNYPMTQIDMAYFNPALSRPDGRELPAVTMVDVGCGQWQQWSRHRNSDGWRPGIDNLESHLAFVSTFLIAEGV